MVESIDLDWTHKGFYDEPLSPGEHRTLAEKAFMLLRQAILTGVLKPGARLPIEELGEMLGMSPMPVREAVRRLDAMGLVENIPHKGARITELSVEDLREFYEARLVLEPLAVYKTAVSFSESNSSMARAALDAMTSSPTGSVDQWAAHSAFHLGIYKAAGSKWLMRLIQPLWETSERYRHAAPIQREIGVRRDEHERILKGCEDHEPAYAAAELFNHLAETANATSQALGGESLFMLIDDNKWFPPFQLSTDLVEHLGNGGLVKGASRRR